jgi:hypothetical protein
VGNPVARLPDRGSVRASRERLVCSAARTRNEE